MSAAPSPTKRPRGRPSTGGRKPEYKISVDPEELLRLRAAGPDCVRAWLKQMPS